MATEGKKSSDARTSAGSKQASAPSTKEPAPIVYEFDIEDIQSIRIARGSQGAVIRNPPPPPPPWRIKVELKPRK